MIKNSTYIFILICLFICLPETGAAQKSPEHNDTFFLAKKKGLLGRFGKSISRTPPDETPVKVENPFLKFKGKIIRSIEAVRLDFEYDIDDTARVKNNIGISIGKLLHKKTSEKVIKHNLFFNVGDQLYPYLLADNERYLRELPFIKDARILVDYADGSVDSVDVVILTRDIFSIGVKLSISSSKRGKVELREENFMGSGTRLLISGYHEDPRSPQTGYGGEFIKRNIGGSFIDWVAGYQDYSQAFTSNRNQETMVYNRIEKPLVTPYIATTGALEWSYQRTRNVYDTDSVYASDFKYASYNMDAWLGYKLGRKKLLYINRERRTHSFIAIRGFKQHYLVTPLKSKTVYDYRLTDFTGTLASINVFKQIFYKSSFIYGFGRVEDIPEGFSVAFTGGYVKKQQIKRPYTGVDISLAHFRKRGFYSRFTYRFGGYYRRKRFEDVDMLVDVNHFTRLRKISNTWFNRIFINSGITARVNPVLNSPLFLNSEFGLNYFNNGTIDSDLRATVKTESVFYNTTKILGFRFAPFIFADVILLKPSKQNLQHSDIFSAIGGGVRTRNENLVFGTIQLKGYYFPRTNGDMQTWKLELSSNFRFRFRSSFISRPDFIVTN